MAGKQTYKSGSIYLTSEGRWRGAYTDAAGARRYVSGTSRAEVAKRLKAAVRRADDGLPAGDERITVAEFLNRWLTAVAPSRSTAKTVATQESYRWAIDLHLIPSLGKLKLRAMTSEHVERMLKEKAAAGYSRATLVRMRSILGMALTWGERRDLVARNVARLAEMPAKIKPKAEGRSLTVEQARALLEAAEGDRLEALYVTGLMLGLRPGELLGLMWDDLDLEAGVLHVRRTLKRERTALVLGEPKTAKSRRALAVPSPVTEALRAHRRRQAEERLIAGPEWEDTGLVFVNHFGRPIDPSNLRREFSRLTEAAGLGHWHPHELRHSAASLLSAAGVPLETIADTLGHVDTRMVSHTYRHHVRPTQGAEPTHMEAMFGT